MGTNMHHIRLVGHILDISFVSVTIGATEIPFSFF